MFSMDQVQAIFWTNDFRPHVAYLLELGIIEKLRGSGVFTYKQVTL